MGFMGCPLGGWALRYNWIHLGVDQKRYVGMTRKRSNIASFQVGINFLVVVFIYTLIVKYITSCKISIRTKIVSVE